MSELWTRLDAPGGASAVLEAMEATPPAAGDHAAQLLRGIAQLEAGDPAAAEADLTAVRDAQPLNPVATLNLSLAKFRNGDAPAAAKLLADAVLFPQRDFLRRALALFWPLRRRTALARTPFGKPPGSSIPHSTDFSRWEKHRGTCGDRARARLAEKLFFAAEDAFQSAHFQTAALLYERAAQVLPVEPLTVASAAHMMLLFGRVEDARALIEPIFEEDAQLLVAPPPEAATPSFIARFAKAFTTSEAGDAQMEPRIAVAHAWILHELGRDREALATLSLVEPAGPDDWNAHFVAAMCWLSLGEEQNYRRLLALALGPYFLDTWEYIVRPFLLQTAAWLATPEADEIARNR